MLNIKDIDNLINVLTEVKKEKEEKQLELLQESIKQELIKEVKSVLLHFESNNIVKFLQESGLELCFDYNYAELIENIENTIKVDVWRVS